MRREISWERDVEISLTLAEIENLQAAHIANKPPPRPDHPMAPIYNFIEEVVYGDDADLITIPPPTPPSG